MQHRSGQMIVIYVGGGSYRLHAIFRLVLLGLWKCGDRPREKIYVRLALPLYALRLILEQLGALTNVIGKRATTFSRTDSLSHNQSGCLFSIRFSPILDSRDMHI